VEAAGGRLEAVVHHGLGRDGACDQRVRSRVADPLAGLGTDVVKVEPPGGVLTRREAQVARKPP
jgi:hypothetical protein